MTTKTVHSLNYRLLVDSSKFEDGMKASRKELNMAKREMRAMQTPAEKMEVRMAKLGELAKKDARFQELYNRSLAQYQEHLKGSTKQSKTLLATSGRLRSMFVGLGAALTAGAIARTIDEQIDRMDALGKASDRLGVSTEFLTRLQFAAGQTSGLGDEQTLKGIEKMTRRISEAAAGAGEAKAVLGELGLEAKQLADLGPEQAFMRIARAMDQVTQEHDRLRIATKLFDDEQAALHTTLKLSNAELEAQFNRADQLGKTLSDIDAINAAKARDAITELETSFSGLARSLSAEVIPGLTEATKAATGLATGLLDRFGQFKRGGVLDGLGIALSNANQRKSNGDSFFDITQFTDPKRLAGNIAQGMAEARQTEKFEIANAVKEATAPEAATPRRVDYMGAFNAFRDSFQSQLAAGPNDPFGMKTAVQETIAPSFSTSGPANAIAAMSSEAFKIQNRTTAINSPEMEVQRRQLDANERTASGVEVIADALTRPNIDAPMPERILS